jgi:hypothetical protein
MELHQQAIHNPGQAGVTDWLVGILMNVPKCPRHIEVLEYGVMQLGQEKLPLGQRFSNQDLLTVPMLRVIDKVMWLRHPKDMQVGTGYYTTRH